MVTKVLSPLAFVQVGINQLVYERESISLDLFLIQSKLDSIELCYRVCDKRDSIVVKRGLVATLTRSYA